MLSTTSHPTELTLASRLNRLTTCSRLGAAGLLDHEASARRSPRRRRLIQIWSASAVGGEPAAQNTERLANRHSLASPRLLHFLGHLDDSLEGFDAASCHRVCSECEHCYWPLDDLECYEGYVARDEQNIGFVALEDRLDGG